MVTIVSNQSSQERPLPFQTYKIAANPYGKDLLLAGRDGILVIDSTQPWRAPPPTRGCHRGFPYDPLPQNVLPHQAPTTAWPVTGRSAKHSVTSAIPQSYYYRPPASEWTDQRRGSMQASSEVNPRGTRLPGGKVGLDQLPASVRYEELSIPWRVVDLAWHPFPSCNAQVAMTWDHAWVIWSLNRPNTPRTTAYPNVKFDQLCTYVPAHSRALAGLQWSPHDPHRLMTYSMDTSICLWDLRTRIDQPQAMLKEWRAPVTKAIFSPRESYTVVGAYNNSIKLWDLRKGSYVVYDRDAHEQRIYSLEFDPIEQRELMSADWDGVVKLWDSTPGQLTHRETVKTVGTFARCRYTTVGRGIVAAVNHQGRSELHIYRLDPEKPSRSTQRPVSPASGDDAKSPIIVMKPINIIGGTGGQKIRDFQWRITKLTHISGTTSDKEGLHHLVTLDCRNCLQTRPLDFETIQRLTVGQAIRATYPMPLGHQNMSDEQREYCRHLKSVSYTTSTYAQPSLGQLLKSAMVKPLSGITMGLVGNGVPTPRVTERTNATLDSESVPLPGLTGASSDVSFFPSSHGPPSREGAPLVTVNPSASHPIVPGSPSALGSALGLKRIVKDKDTSAEPFSTSARLGWEGDKHRYNFPVSSSYSVNRKPWSHAWPVSSSVRTPSSTSSLLPNAPLVGSMSANATRPTVGSYSQRAVPDRRLLRSEPASYRDRGPLATPGSVEPPSWPFSSRVRTNTTTPVGRHRGSMSESAAHHLERHPADKPSASSNFHHFQKLLETVPTHKLPYPKDAVEFLQEVNIVQHRFPSADICDVQPHRRSCHFIVPMGYGGHHSPIQLFVGIQVHPQYPKVSPWYEIDILGGIIGEDKSSVLQSVQNRVHAVVNAEHPMLSHLVPKIVEAARSALAQVSRPLEQSDKFQPGISPSGRSSGFHRPSSQGTISDGQSINSSPSINIPVPSLTPLWSPSGSVSASLPTPEDGYISRSLGSYLPFRYGSSKLRQSIVPGESSSLEDSDSLVQQFSKSLESATSFPSQFGSSRRGSSQINNHLLPPSMYHPMESHQRSAPAPLVSSDIGKSPTQLWPHRVSRLTAPGSPLLSDESELAHSGPSSMGNSSGTSEESFHLLTDVRSPPPHGRVNRSLAIHTVPSMVTQTLKKSAKAKASGVITTTNARPVAMPFSGNALPDSDFPSQMESYYRPDYWEAQHDSMVPSSVNQGLSAPVSTADHGSESNQPFVALSGSKLSDFEYSTEGDDVDGYDFADDSTEDDTDEEYADDEDEDIFLEGLPNKVRIKSGGHMIHKARHQQAREIPFPRLCGGVFCGPNRLVCFYAALYTKENFPNSIASPPVQGTYPVVIPPLQSRVNATLATRASHSSAGGTSTLTTPASDATPSMSCTVMPTPTIMELIAHPVEGQRSSVIPATPLFSSKLGHVYATEGTSVATPLNPTSVYLAPPDPLASASYASLFQLRFLRFHLDMEHFKSYDQLSELRSKSQQRYYFSHQDRESYISDRLDDLPMFSSATMSSRTRRLSPVRSDIPSSDESSAITHPHSPRSIRPLKTGLQRSETLTEDEEPSNNTESGLIVYPSGSGHGRTPVAASYEARDRTVRRIGRQPRSGPSGVGPQATSSESLADSSTRSVPDRGGDQGMYSSWDNFVAEGDDEDEAGTALYSDADDDSSNEKDFLSLPTLYVRPKTTRTSPEIIENPKRSPFFPDMGAQVGVALATERKRWDTGGLGSQSGELDLGNYIYVAQVDTLSPVDYDLAHTYQIYGHDPVALARANAGAAALHNRPDLVQTWTLVMHLLTNYSPYFHQVNAAFHPYVDPFSPLFAPSLVMSCFSVPMRTPAAPTAKVSNKPTELPTSAGHRASNWGPLAGEQSWLTMLPGDPTMPQAVQWGAHPLGRHLVDHLFYYYEALHDIQTLCMLVCILHQPFPPTPAWMFLNDRRTWINSYQRAYGRPMVYSSGSHKTSSLYTPVPAELVALARPLSDTLSRFATGSNPSNGAPMALALPPPMTVPAFASIIQSPSGLTTPLSNPSMGATDYFGAHWVPPNSTSTGIGHSATGGTTVSESGSGSMERGDRLFEGSVPPVGVPEVMAGQLLHAPSTGASSGPLAIRPGEVNAAFMAPTQLAENRSSPQLPNGIISHYHPLVVNLAGYSYQGGPINSSPKRSWIYPPIGPTLPSSSLPRTSSVSFSPQWGYTSSPTKAGSGSTVQRTSGSSQPPISAGPFTSHFGNLPFIYANNTNPDVLGEEGDALSDRQTPIPAVGSFPNRGFVSHTNQDESLSPTTPTQPGSGNHKPLGEAGSSVTTTSRFFNWLKPGPGHRSLSQDLSASKKGVDGRTPFELMNETHSTISRNPSLPSAEESRLGKGDQSQGKRTEVRNGNFRRRIPNREANEFIALFNVEDQRKQLEHNPVSLAPTSWSLATAMDDEFDNDYNPHWQPLLNPQRAALYDHYRLLYADILGRWGFQQARCEVLKFVETPKLQRLVHETMTYQLQFTVDRAEARGQTTDFPPLFTMHAKDSIICAVCRQMVKGSSLFCWCCGHAGHADHFQAWFDKDPDRSCPAGCGCQCYTVALGQLCPPERGRSWTRETSRPVDAPQAPAVGLVDVSKKPSLTTANSGDALTMAEPLRDDTRSGTTANHSTGDHRSRLTKGKEPASQCMPDSPVNPADLAMPLDLRYHHNF